MVYLNYVHNSNVVRLFTGNRVTLYSFIYVSSDFIFGNGKKRSALPNFFENRIAKVCSVIHKTFFSFFLNHEKFQYLLNIVGSRDSSISVFFRKGPAYSDRQH